MSPKRDKGFVSYTSVEGREVLQDFFEEKGIQKTDDELYIPPHKALIGLDFLIPSDWTKGEPLFDLASDHELTYEKIDEPDLFSPGFFVHVYEGDKKGGYHFPSWLPLFSKGKLLDGSRKNVGNKGAYRVNTEIAGKIRPYRIMFPEDWDGERLTKSIKQAYWNAKHDEGNNFIGTDEEGFPIRLSLDRQTFSIVSAYPNYPEPIIDYFEKKFPKWKHSERWNKIKYFIPYFPMKL